MENKKVSELRAEAKRLRFRGYSRLRKVELINLLINQNRPISLPKTKKNKFVTMAIFNCDSRDFQYPIVLCDILSNE